MRSLWVLFIFVCSFVRAQPVLSLKKPAPLQFLCTVQAPFGQWAALTQFVAGMNSSAYSLPADQKAAWNRHSEVASAGWTNAQTRYLDPIQNWREHSFDKSATTDLAFYPFSGPDAANVLSFFPDAREYLLIGLEPVGCIPAGLADYNVNYFSALRHSLDAILTINFFRTNDMEVDFGSANLRGVLPALLFMIARSGYAVMDVTRIDITADGAIARSSDETKEDGKGSSAKTPGVAIRFVDRRNTVRVLRYFSLNLQDYRLRNKPGAMKYLSALPETNTLIKSASYLLHSPHFSITRDTILAKSRLVVEDDSGIPFRYFDTPAWDVRLYGTYKEPITRFKKWHQVDLESAFTSRRDVRPLGFAIGYYHVRESNLLVATPHVAYRKRSDD
jgi:hypothetical protein